MIVVIFNMQELECNIMSKILFFATVVPKKYETKIKHISNAANRFVINLCNALRDKNHIHIMSYIGIDVNPEIKKRIKNRVDGVSYFFKDDGFIYSLLNLKRETIRRIVCADILVTYNVVYAWMFVPWIAKRYKKKSVLVLADFSDSKAFSSYIRKIYAFIQKMIITRYDYVIGLSENVEKYMRKGQKFICIEGGIEQSVYDYFKWKPESEQIVTEKNEVTFMYAGLLAPVTGIEQLLLAFESTEQSFFRLKITGGGVYENLVTDAASRDHRIKYMGCMDYEVYLDELASADILINPRNMSLSENENNFPSKIMEYLATGKQIISTKFPGWQKYKDYILFVDSDVYSLKCAIESCVVCNKDAFNARRKFASQFIWSKQAEQINSFIKEN